MNFLLRLVGLEDHASVHRVVDSAWHIGQPLPPAVLYSLIALGLVLATINFLPWISMRPSVRISTFVLRALMVAVLIAVVFNLEWHVQLELNDPQRWLVLVDDSASMATKDVDGKSRFSAALGDLNQIENSAGDDVRLSVATFSGSPLRPDQPGNGPTRFADAVARTALARSQVDRLIVLTDGRDSDRRDLKRLGEDLKARDIDLAVRLYGSKSTPLDAGISAEPQRNIIRLGEDLIIRGAISGTIKAEQNVTLKENGKEVKTLTVSPASGGRFEIVHRPKTKGQHTYSLELAGSDTVTQNNATSFTANVIEERINVLLVEGFPRFEFKLMKSVLEVDPLVKLVSVCHVPGGGVYVQGEPLHRNPEQGLIASQADLFKYDVVILRDLARSYFLAGGDTTESRLRNLVDFVTKRGGGLMVLGGQDVYRAGGYENSHLAEVLPFDLSDRINGDPQFEGMFFVSVPKSAYDHPLLRLLPEPGENRTRLDSLQKLDGSNNVGLLKPLATPLLMRSVQFKGNGTESVEKETPILGYMAVGEGKVLAGAVDTFWRWQLQPDYDDPALTMILANAMRYLAPSPGKKPGAPNVGIRDGTPQVGQDLLLTTDLKDNNFDPIRGAELVVTVTPPDGNEYRMYPRDLPEEPGHYAYRVQLDQPGAYKVNAKYGKLDTTREFVAGAAAGEFADLSIDTENMQRLTKAADGELVSDVGRWLSSTDMSPAHRAAVRDLEIWNSPLVLLLFLGLVSLDCYLRKRQGMA